MDTKGTFSDEYIGLIKCNLNKSPCIYQRPTAKEIQELCDEKGIEQQYVDTVMKIFNNIEGSSGGAASEDSPNFSSSQITSESSASESSASESSSSISSDDDTLSPSQYVSKSGYTQTEQNNYVDRVLLLIALSGGAVVMGVGMATVSGAQDFLVSQGIMDPLCKGPLDRVAREAARLLEPALAGPSCEDRLKRAEDIMGWARGVIGTSYGSFSWANWDSFRKTLKDRIFEPMEIQKRHTLKMRKARRKKRTQRRAKKSAKKSKKEKKKASKSAKKSAKKSRSRKPPSPNGPSGSNQSLRNSKSKSKSRSKLRSRSM